MNRSLLSVFGLVFFVLLGTASISFGGGAAVTMTQILSSVRPVITLLRVAKLVSKNTTESVNNSFVELSTLIREKKLGTENIIKMESSLLVMRSKADSLNFLLDQSESYGSSLFSLLRKRAKQNETKSLRKAMLNDIAAKEGEFESQLEIANGVLEKVENSIQKYDDILGYLQVSIVTSEFQEYMDIINGVISEGTRLNNEIQSAITEGLNILSSIENQAGAAEPAAD